MSLARFTRIACIGLVLATAGNASAQPADPAPSPDAATVCADEHVAAQSARREGKLLRAREHLSRCVADSCPGLVRSDCGKWIAELAESVPSIVIEVRADRDGASPVVEIDGAPSTSPAGASIEVDPGPHVVRATLADGSRRERRIALREGEIRKLVVLDFTSPTAGRPSSGPSPATWVLAGIAGAAGISFAVGAGLGFAKQSELDDCAPGCAQDDVDQMRTDYLVADISLGVSLGFGAAALIVGLVTGLSGSEPRSEPGPRPSASLGPRGLQLVW